MPQNSLRLQPLVTFIHVHDARCVFLFVSPVYTSGGLWFPNGNHQLILHCHHMGTELMTPSAPPARGKRAKEMDTKRERPHQVKQTLFVCFSTS